MKKKIRPDDDPRLLPTVKSSIPQLDGKLRLVTGKGDRAVIELDKDYPEISLACKEIKIPDGSQVLVLGGQKGFLGVSLATVNPGSQFVFYEPNLINAQITDQNIHLNYETQNISLVNEHDFAEQQAKKDFSHVIYSVPSYASHEVIADNIATGASFLAPEGKFFLLTRTKSGGIRHGKMLEDILGAQSEQLGLGKGHRIYRSSLGKNIESVDTRKNITYSVLGHEISVQTEPGLFSKESLDEGTRILLESVELKNFKRLLDVGCGWGAIGITAAIHNQQGNVFMMDVDTRATRVAQSNIDRLGLSDRVKIMSSPSVRDVPDVFDMILSNPPFHSDLPTLTELFEGIRAKLNKGGSFYFVVERSFADKLSTLAGQIFKNVKAVTNQPEKPYIVYGMHK